MIFSQFNDFAKLNKKPCSVKCYFRCLIPVHLFHIIIPQYLILLTLAWFSHMRSQLYQHGTMLEELNSANILVLQISHRL